MLTSPKNFSAIWGIGTCQKNSGNVQKLTFSEWKIWPVPTSSNLIKKKLSWDSFNPTPSEIGLG